MKIELCPAPVIPGAVPPEIEALEEMLRADSEHREALFNLGNVLLRGGRNEDAARAYQRLLAIVPDWPEVRCNLGICYRRLGRTDDALSQLKQAVLQRPELILAQQHLAEIQLLRGDNEGAAATLDRLLRTASGYAPALTALAELQEKLAGAEAAREYYERSFAADPKQPQVRNRLGAYFFSDGCALWSKGETDAAFAVWAEGYRRYPRAFSAERIIAKELRRLSKEFAQENTPAELLSRVGKSDPGFDLHRFFNSFLFSLNLIPEAYIEPGALEDEVRNQQNILKERGTFPYANYRLGLAYAFLGRLDEAVDELAFSADHLPASKKKSLKLDPILTFIRQVRSALKGEDMQAAEATENEWMRFGFADPFLQQAWSKSGACPAEAADWRAAGLTAQQCREWRTGGLAPAQAKDWLEHGFPEAKEAGRLARAGLTPREAGEWLRCFKGRHDHALQWRGAGFVQPEEAAIWSTLFTFPWEAARWRDNGFGPNEAEHYLERGIKDPFQARQQAASGMSMQEPQAELEEELSDITLTGSCSPDDDIIH